MVGNVVCSGVKLSHSVLVLRACSFLAFTGCVYVYTEYPVSLPHTKTAFERVPVTKLVDVYGIPLLGGPFVVECGGTSLVQEKRLWELLYFYEIRRLFFWVYRCPYIVEVKASTETDWARVRRSRDSSVRESLRGWSLVPIAAYLLTGNNGSCRLDEVTLEQVLVGQKSKSRQGVIRSGQVAVKVRHSDYRDVLAGSNVPESGDRSDFIRRSYLGGCTLQVIADKCNLSRQRVHQILVRIADRVRESRL